MAHILLNTFGSFGDLYPYLAIGAELRRRGHAVTIATSAVYRAQAESAGLGFHAVRPDVDLGNRELVAYAMEPRRGTERIIRYLASLVRDSYEDILPLVERADLTVTHPITFGAVLAARKLRRRWASSVLAPMSFFSVYDPPVLAPAPWLAKFTAPGARFTRGLFALAKASTLPWLDPVRRFGRTLGLDMRANPLFEGQHSPSLVLALFSDALAPPQRDWPSNTVITGFPFYDSGAVPAELSGFLAAGDPPVVFTLGSSATAAAGAFYTESLDAAGRLGMRAVFLTGSHPQGLPERLPPGAIAIPYAPHAAVFPAAAAIVHQGGIGTTAQAMRAGRPMLVVPFAHDQYDNAARVQRLGIAAVLPQTHYNSARAETALRDLLNKPSHAQAAAAIAERVRNENGALAASHAIERML